MGSRLGATVEARRDGDLERVLITGCSTGIGRATAQTLVAAGYAVVATARHPETLEGIGANERIRAAEPGPDAVARIILAALRARRPRARHPAAIPFAARIAMALPDVGKDLVVRRLFELDSLRRTRPVTAQEVIP